MSFVRQSFAPDAVVLLHGIFRTGRCMKKLEKKLQHDGYTAFNLTYPSTRHSIEELSEWLQQKLSDCGIDNYPTLHMVGYSMGGLIIRQYLERYRPQNLGRVVMLATPNHGSEIADFIKDWRLYKRLYGPAGQQLVTQKRGGRTPVGKIDYELGIIAGNRSLSPIVARLLLPKPHDGTVSVESTRLEGMRDHLVVRASHTYFPQNREVMKQTSWFLKHGAFQRS